ncbi:MAG TPA: sarcosine oxidase subunit gamma family protein [Stellaceae bacterium]|nr:sarcosine oxidase subunit gamma family protein [Stellaceae bacterium]
MADATMMRSGAFDRFAEASATASIRALPPAARFVFRGRPAAIETAGIAFGVALPGEACRAATAGDRSALWLGPDEWLLLGPDGSAPAISQSLAKPLAALPHSLVDVSHRQTALEVSGSGAATLLNAGCPLDLDIKTFPVGMCTRTVLGKAEIVLWRVAPTRFHVEVWRSFGAYVWRFLEEARLERGP